MVGRTCSASHSTIRKSFSVNRLSAQRQEPFPAVETVVEVSLIPIKWDPYAENPKACRESEGSATTRIPEGLETNLGVLGRARVGGQTMGSGRNAFTSRGPIRLHFFQRIERLARKRIGQACARRHGKYRPHR